MKCHYITVIDLGEVLIPGCMSVAVSNDIDDCVCYPDDIYKTDKELIHELRKRNNILKMENKKLRDELNRTTEE